MPRKIILGFSCGSARKESPGLSNEALAEEIIVFARRHCNTAILAQGEIGRALRERAWVPDHEVTKHRRGKGYVDTEEVARQMLAHISCGYAGERELWVFAHPIHLPRCMRVLRKLGIQRAHAFYAPIPCDPRSPHLWTRSPILIHLHEFLGFPIYFLRGYYSV